jgi:hypothetical protein
MAQKLKIFKRKMEIFSIVKYHQHYERSNYLTGWIIAEPYKDIDFDWESTPLEIKANSAEFSAEFYVKEAVTITGGVNVYFGSGWYTSGSQSCKLLNCYR